MPRLSPSILRQAHNLHPFLPALLRPCRDLRSAWNELRWLREHVLATTTKSATPSVRKAWRNIRLRRLCLERSTGKPLQYILGSQPFGDLDILCERGVLIPRPETESVTTHLASLIRPSLTKDSTLRILDLCTGTGCISLLLHSLLAPHAPNLQTLGIDKSPQAISLAKRNLHHNTTTLGHIHTSPTSQIHFAQDDLFAPRNETRWLQQDRIWDIVIANPPYISPTAFNKTTSRSVRNYEPLSALVPSPQPARDESATDEARGDMFYPRLIHLARCVQAQLLLVEVADMSQARRVARMVVDGGDGYWDGVEIWRDWPGQGGEEKQQEEEDQDIEGWGRKVRVRGEGNGRGVLAWRGRGCNWVGRGKGRGS